MNRKVTRMVAAATASVIMPLTMQAAAEEPPAAARPNTTVMAVEAGTSLLPKRWCVEAHMITPSLAIPFSLREPTGVAWQGAGQSVYDFQLVDVVADRTSLSYRLADFGSDRLVTFWSSDTLGVFLGISEGGYLSLSIGP